jgi:tetratricopeptide (TPR) repeat protein
MPIRVRAKRAAVKRAPGTTGASLPFGLPQPPYDWPQKPPGISLCMIVKNEERFLEQCLRSVAGLVDEINIVDTGSRDRTVDIARQFGARVEHSEWRNDFSWARNKALAMATRRWVMQLDADEEVTADSKDALDAIRTAPAHLMGVWVRCVNASDRYRGGGSISHAIIRIFPNTERIRFQGAIHEFPSIDGSPFSMKAVPAPVKLIHHGYLADVVKDRDKFARNMSIIEQSVEHEPNEAFHWYNLGMTAHINGDHERGAPALEKMWELCKANGMRAFTANGLQMLADMYTEHLGDPEKGLHYARECLVCSPHYANAHFSAGKALFALKRYDEAREMYGAAIADGEHTGRQFVVDDDVPAWKAHCEIGSTFAEQERHADALEWFDRGLANRPAIQPLRINRAKALENLGRFAEAEETLRALYEEFGDEHSGVEYVNYLLRHHKEREAVALIERDAERFGTVAATTMLLAAAHVTQKNQWGDGEEYLRRAERIDPANEAVASAITVLEANRGAAGDALQYISQAMSSGQFAEALAHSLKGIEALPADERFRYFAALACANLQRKDEALAHLERIGDAPTAEAAWLLRATLLRETGGAAGALDALRNVVRLNPQNLDALLMQAALCDAAGEVKAAESALLAALPLNKPRVAVELAALYLRAGRLQDAKRVAEEALA